MGRLTIATYKTPRHLLVREIERLNEEKQAVMQAYSTEVRARNIMQSALVSLLSKFKPLPVFATLSRSQWTPTASLDNLRRLLDATQQQSESSEEQSESSEEQSSK